MSNRPEQFRLATDSPAFCEVGEPACAVQFDVGSGPSVVVQDCEADETPLSTVGLEQFLHTDENVMQILLDCSLDDIDLGAVDYAEVAKPTYPMRGAVHIGSSGQRWMNAGAWISSLLLHGAIAAAAVAAGRYLVSPVLPSDQALATHAQATFALGDASETEGQLNRDGLVNLPVGSADSRPQLPAVPPESSDETADTLEVTASTAQVQPAVPDETPGPEFVKPSTSVPPTFKSLEWKNEPAHAAGRAAQSALAGKESAQPGDSNAAMKGVENPAGQGGASTGRDGSADTGLPGVPAGLRDGQNLIRPTYPEISRRLGEVGTVVLNVEVLEDGSIGAITVVSDAGYPRLAAAAVASLQGSILRPALSKSGKPMRDLITIPYDFHRPKGGR